MKVNSVFIIKNLFFSENEYSEKEFHNIKMIMKIRVTQYKNDSSAHKVS